MKYQWIWALIWSFSGLLPGIILGNISGFIPFATGTLWGALAMWLVCLLYYMKLERPR